MTGLTLSDPAFLGAAAGFSPLSLSPVLWLDASDAATITSSGGLVSQWNDKSGNGRNVTQGTSTLQPKTGVTTRNGLNVLTFDGSNDVLTSAANSPDTTVMSAFVVARHSSFAPGTPRAFELTNSGGNGRLFLISNAAPGQIAQAIVSTSLGNFLRETPGGTMTVNVWRSFGFVWAGGTTNPANLTIRVAGADANGASTTSTAAIISTLNQPYRIGNSAGGARSWPGEIAEIIIWHRALSTSEVGQIETYLASKWGL